MKRIVTVSGIFLPLLFLVVGGTWISLVNFLPESVPRGLLTVAMGLLFVAVFLYDMINHVRNVLSGSERLMVPLILTVLNVHLLLLAFAAIYFYFGIIDTTRPGSPIIGAPGSSEDREVLPDSMSGEDDSDSPSTQETKPKDKPDDAAAKVYHFALCCYYSVVTFTTLGYGDFQPVGWGRAMAGLEAFVGYLVLGILASTSASILQASAKETPDRNEDETESDSDAS